MRVKTWVDVGDVEINVDVDLKKMERQDLDRLIEEVNREVTRRNMDSARAKELSAAPSIVLEMVLEDMLVGRTAQARKRFFEEFFDELIAEIVDALEKRQWSRAICLIERELRPGPSRSFAGSLKHTGAVP